MSNLEQYLPNFIIIITAVIQKSLETLKVSFLLTSWNCDLQNPISKETVERDFLDNYYYNSCL